MTSEPHFWVYDWLDARGVSDMVAAERALETERDLDEVADFANRRPLHKKDVEADAASIVAGRGVDLSGHLDCNAPGCRIRQVNELLRRAWHYFDKVVVADAVSHEITAHWDAPVQDRREWLLSHLRVLLYLRSIGAEGLVTFHEKPSPCEKHWSEHAIQDASLAPIVDARVEVVRRLAKESHIEFEVHSDGVGFALNHQHFEHTVWDLIPDAEARGQSDAELKEVAAFAVYRRYLAHLTSDVAASRRLGCPLGTATWFHGQLLAAGNKRATHEEVAFHLDLPILNAIPLDILLRLRTDEHEAFERFRLALRKGIHELLRIDANNTTAALAREIRQDLIEPALLGIQQRLSYTQRALGKKVGVGIALGSFATTCGLLVGVDPGIATMAGVAALTTVAGPAAAKNIEERHEVSLADMYFLWRAVRHSRESE